jgi:hypothetical protein
MCVYRIVIFTSEWRASSFASTSDAPFRSSSVIKPGHQIEHAAFGRHAGDPGALFGEDYSQLLSRRIVDKQTGQDRVDLHRQLVGQLVGHVRRFVISFLSRELFPSLRTRLGLTSAGLSSGDGGSRGFDQLGFQFAERSSGIGNSF